MQHFINIKQYLAASLLLILILSTQHVRAFSTTNSIERRTSSEKVNRPIVLRESVGTRLTNSSDDGISTFPESTAAALDWSFLDSVCLIHCPNGDVDGSRIKSTKGILDEVNLLDSVTIKEFDTDDEDRVRGCYSSHISVFRDILRKNSKPSSIPLATFDFFGVFGKSSVVPDEDESDDLNVLIFEDNLFLGNRKLTQETIDAVSDFIQKNKDGWDVIHLAYIPYVPDLQISKTDDKRIVKLSTSNTQSALGTTAYIINSKAMKQLVEEDYKNGYTVSIPDAMATLFGESRYALNPTAFVRAPATKSLVNPQLDDLRTILFRPSVVSLVQQILVSTGLSTTVLLPIVILLLVITSINSGTSTVQASLEFANYGTIDGPILLPIINALFSLVALGIIVQGALLAPKPESADTSEDIDPM